MEHLRFSKTRIGAELLDRLVKATMMLSELTGKDFFVVKGMFGKYRVITKGDLILAQASTHGRPGTHTVVGVLQDRILLPSQSEADFDEVRKWLELDTSQKTDELRKIVFPISDVRR